MRLKKLPGMLSRQNISPHGVMRTYVVLSLNELIVTLNAKVEVYPRALSAKEAPRNSGTHAYSYIYIYTHMHFPPGMHGELPKSAKRLAAAACFQPPPLSGNSLRLSHFVSARNLSPANHELQLRSTLPALSTPPTGTLRRPLQCSLSRRERQRSTRAPGARVG